MVKAKLEKTTLGDVAEYIEEVRAVVTAAKTRARLKLATGSGITLHSLSS